jgi:uncharacterized protein (TIGR00369 family)
MSTDMLEIYRQLIPALKHCALLQIDVTHIEPGKIILELPYNDNIIGNPETGVIHGGALTTLMDTACGFSAISALENAPIAPTLDLRIDYMRSAQPGLTVYGQAEIYRKTANVLFSKGIAYQEDMQKPIAHCSATFMCLDKEALESSGARS